MCQMSDLLLLQYIAFCRLSMESWILADDATAGTLDIEQFTRAPTSLLLHSFICSSEYI